MRQGLFLKHFRSQRQSLHRFNVCHGKLMLYAWERFDLRMRWQCLLTPTHTNMWMEHYHGNPKVYQGLERTCILHLFPVGGKRGNGTQLSSDIAINQWHQSAAWAFFMASSGELFFLNEYVTLSRVSKRLVLPGHIRIMAGGRSGKIGNPLPLSGKNGTMSTTILEFRVQLCARTIPAFSHRPQPFLNCVCCWAVREPLYRGPHMASNGASWPSASQ